MLVWSMIAVKEFVSLRQTGELAMKEEDVFKSDTLCRWRGGKPHIWENILNAYLWMSTRLQSFDPNNDDLVLPRWVWHTYDYVTGRDLIDRFLSHEGMFRTSMLCLFDMEPQKVLLSDHSAWHRPLNGSYLPLEEEWDENDMLKVDSYPSWEKTVASWDRIFNVAGKRFVQGVTWKLRYSELVEARYCRRFKSSL